MLRGGWRPSSQTLLQARDARRMGIELPPHTRETRVGPLALHAGAASWQSNKVEAFLTQREMPLDLAHRNRSDFCDFCDCDAHRGPQKSQRFPRQEKAMLHVASDLRFRAAISEPRTPSFCGISVDLAPSTRKSLAIAIVRFWCAKPFNPLGLLFPVSFSGSSVCV